jgi:hypothetical protein
VHPVRSVDFGGVYPEQAAYGRAQDLVVKAGADFGCRRVVDVVVGAETEPRGAWVLRHEQCLNVGVVTQHVSDQFFEVTFDDCT